MLRIRCSVLSTNLRRVSIEPVASSAFRGFGTVANFSKVVNVNASKRAGSLWRRPFEQYVPVAVGGAMNQKRFIRNRAPPGSEEKPPEGEQAKAEETQEKTAEGEKAEEKADAKAEEEPKNKGLFAQIQGLRDDFVNFPDIYNAPNMMNFVLFTIFCLASTGSNVEADWWVNQWGIDAAFKPWTWFLHSLMMNNFLSMSFAMMLVHSMCHSVLPTLGNRGLLTYCAIVSVVSGVAIWALNAAMGNRSEKQYGPWDVLSALFVMQYLHQGLTPLAILGGFNGWVRYACYVGAVCILYYDYQPVIFGTALGYALCLTRFKAPLVR